MVSPDHADFQAEIAFINHLTALGKTIFQTIKKGFAKVNDKKDLTSVLQSLSNALDTLEQSVDFHLDDKKRLTTVDKEISDLMVDRSRLAQSLDKAEARATRLEDANKEVSKRLVKAMDSIRTILEDRTEQKHQIHS